MTVTPPAPLILCAWCRLPLANGDPIDARDPRVHLRCLQTIDRAVRHAAYEAFARRTFGGEPD